ncbi:probable receptor-like protein kinase At5g59700 [Rutidosis leptorrhynchoides]|uniref:probable receptor-like protein kinase At5g59700 n=1 Tax=Rutidosis leptorrhynchoides TaxID=125765 RepID=UPI003A996FEA
MCLDIASGLSYLHTPDDYKKCIIHTDIKSRNILLGENLEVKIADFGLSIFHPKIAGTDVYMDPEYKDAPLALSGKLAYDQTYMNENGNGIAPVARRRFKDGTLMEMVDSQMMGEAHKLSSTIKMRPTQDSLDEFFKVTCKCVAEVQADRPKMKEVIDGLIKAKFFQGNYCLKYETTIAALQGWKLNPTTDGAVGAGAPPSPNNVPPLHH